MKKLLHERLGDDFTDHIHCGGWEIYLEPQQAYALADEIERYYIPRPRFADGEPVQFGDSFSVKNERVISIEFMPASVCINGDLDAVMVPNGTPIKRPSSKVLDADGMEIKVGDTVYTPNSDIKLHVLMVDRNFDNEIVIQTDGGSYKPKHLTHKVPDSLEKLLHDMESWNELKMKTFCDEWIDRLSALIERGNNGKEAR